jgi:hypothetical protein
MKIIISKFNNLLSTYQRFLYDALLHLPDFTIDVMPTLRFADEREIRMNRANNVMEQNYLNK